MVNTISYCDCLSLQTQTLSITESKQVCICKPAKIQYKFIFILREIGTETLLNL
jgi:hypothetical protein